jgi:HAD superfamily phosphoserine phosphatase-like hydrolase
VSTHLSTGAGDRAPVHDYVLVDFDGTLAEADIGNRFFHRFTRDEERWNELIAGWKREELSARECLAFECALSDVDERAALEFFDGFVLAPGALEFVAAARRAGHEIVVASDGLEMYVSRLLARAGLEVPFSANRIHFQSGGPIPEYASGGPAVRLPDGRVAGSRPGAPAGCGRCGNCKGAILEAAARGGGRRTVLVGDGYSDRCAARVAEVVYAKDDLLGYCRERGIAARPFTVLEDVARAEGWPWAGASGPAASLPTTDSSRRSS